MARILRGLVAHGSIWSPALLWNPHGRLAVVLGKGGCPGPPPSLWMQTSTARLRTTIWPMIPCRVSTRMGSSASAQS